MENGASDRLAEARFYLTLGRWDQAAACAREALRHDPDDGNALVMLARVLVGDPHSDTALAFDVAKQATRYQPDNPDAWLALARAAHGYREVEGVSAAWQAVRLAPSEALTHRVLALACANLAQIDPTAVPGLQATAYGAARRAVRLDSADVENHSTLAWVCHVYTDHAGVVAALREALRLDPDNAMARHVQGLVNLHNAHTDAGTQALTAVLRDDPTRQDVRLLLDRVGTARAAGPTVVALILASLILTAGVVTVRVLAPRTGWMGDGRAAALAVWAVGAAATVWLVRRTAGTRPWGRLRQWLGERPTRGGIVAPTLTSLVALVFAAAAHPGDPPVVVLSTPLVFIVGYQLHYLGSYAWGLLERRHETRLTTPV